MKGRAAILIPPAVILIAIIAGGKVSGLGWIEAVILGANLGGFAAITAVMMWSK